MAAAITSGVAAAAAGIADADDGGIAAAAANVAAAAGAEVEGGGVSDAPPADVVGAPAAVAPADCTACTAGTTPSPVSARNAVCPASMPLIMAVCVPFSLGTLRKPAEQPSSAPLRGRREGGERMAVGAHLCKGKGGKEWQLQRVAPPPHIE